LGDPLSSWGPDISRRTAEIREKEIILGNSDLLKISNLIERERKP